MNHLNSQQSAIRIIRKPHVSKTPMIQKVSLFVCFIVCFTGFTTSGQILPDTSILHLKAPESFQASFITTKGEFVVEAIRFWEDHPIPDEPVKHQNLQGVVAYSRDWIISWEPN